ncbi:MAG: phage tail assembly chaperone [Pseudomonadota bacterium]
MTAKPLPWADLMAFCYGRLRIAPQAFWQLTLCELHCLMVGLTAKNFGNPDRQALEHLMNIYPDQGHVDEQSTISNCS